MYKMEAYQKKLDRRKERYQELSNKAENRADAHKKYSDSLVENIPFGQPILVGHHSESSHRRTLERSQNHMYKMLDERKKSDYYEGKAESVGKSGISSDDPTALEQLEQKLKSLVETRNKMKEVNTDFKKCKADVSKMSTISDDTKEKLSSALDKDWRTNPKPYETFTLTNLGAKIRSVKKRILALEITSKEITKEEIYKDIRILDNTEDNRLQIFFNGKPSENIRKELKSSGFRWSGYNKCWQCYRNRRAIETAKFIINML